MAESTSTLQAKLNALTHGKVDIMLDADTFKSTTQILREMSAAWEDMTDIERAAALELMGGKRQANILSSVIQNFETVEDVITTSMNSSGSAIAENEKWLDSIEGKTYQFTNALQTMWSNMLDSEMIKGFIDFGTDAIQFLDTGAGKVIALVAALKLMAKFKGFSIKGIAQGLGDTINKITTAQQTLQTLGKTTPIGSGYDLTNINAYAQAVSNLTAKQQANLLASQGLNQEQIRYALTLNQVDDAAMREAMAHTHAATAKQQENIVGAQSIQQKAQELAMSLRTKAATEDETRAKELNVVADILENSTSEEAIANNLQEAVTSKSVSASLAAETTSTLGLTTAKKGLLATTKALMVANPVGFWITVGTTILSLIPIVAELVDAFTKSAEEIKQEAQEISQAYEDAVNEVNNNLQSLGVTNDSASINALEKEFATLTAGVDKYGNNLSLTSDEYERYRDICEQIVGINPQIARGYDSATEAIGNNASILSQLIDLQKEQARIAAEQYFSDDNIETLTEDAVNDYKDVIAENNKTRQEAFGAINESFDKAFAEYVQSNPSVENTTSEKWKWILSQIGYEVEEASKIVESYRRDYGDGLVMYDTSFFNDYSEEIKANMSKFGSEYVSGISKAFAGAEEAFASAEKKLADAKDGLIDTLLIAPTSSKDYNKLTSEGKNFLVEWIKNSEMFKIDDATLTDEEVKDMKDTILSMMDILVSDAKNIEYNGEKFTAQELLSKVYDLNPSTVNYEDYKKQINEMLTAFWNSLTDAQKKEYGFEKFEDFTISLGFNFVADDEAESKMISRYAKIKGITEDEARKYFESLPAVVVKRLLAIDWNTVDEGNVDDTIENAKGKQSSVISSKTYSTLSESVESYNEILTQTAEIAADNTEVTQEYKDSLTDLGISQEDLNDCFDDANPLIVKNAKALNKLVKEANKNVATNVKLAKSNARLDYYQLVKQLSETLNGTKKLDDATRNSVYSTLEQINAVEKALYQYQLLEDTLLGVNNAFNEFAEAQEIDSLNTYGDSYVEMAQTMYDALYKTGQVGTEQFWAAAEALVPTEVYQHLTEDADRMKAIYDYYNQYVLPSLKLDEDELSLDYDAIEQFVKRGLNRGVFEGDVEDFDLVEGMNLDEAAEKLGYTKTQAYALFAELDKYNTAGNEHSFLSQLDDSLEGRITNITNDVENLNKQKLALLEDGGYDKNKDKIQEIDKQIQAAEKDLNSLGEEAYTTWQKYTANEAALAALDEASDKSQKISDVWPKELITDLGLNGDMTVEEAYNRLLAKQLELEEPTVLTAQLAIDNIDTKIAELDAMLKDPKKLKVEAETQGKTPEELKKEIEQEIQALQEDKAVIATKFGIELSEEDKKTLEDELNKIEEFTINDKSFNVIANGTSATMTALRNINNYTLKNKSYTVTENRKIVGSGGGHYTQANGTAHANGSWGAPRTETALVGELGPEMLVRNGRWTTVGDNGAEFTQVKKGDIIFNHKQTEDLLSKGYVTGRGKAYASGTAYSGLWKPTSPNTSQSNKPGNDFSATGNRLFNAADSLSSAASSISSSASDAADEFREVFDWIEVRLEEINEDINLRSAQLENKIGHSAQNKTVDKIIDLNQKLYDNLIAGSEKYYAYANKLLSKVPAEYRAAAQDGTIAIEEFVGEADEKTLEAIQEYREWVQKGDEAAQQAEETLTEISTLAKQAIDNVADDYGNKTSIRDSKIEQLDAQNALLETTQGSESAAIYQEMIKQNNKNISTLETQRDKMQAELDKRVESGQIKKYSQDWYDAVNDIAAVDTEIIELKTDTENYQDAINELHWENFDNLMSQYESVSDEAENLIDILGNKDMVDESGNWTDEGIASLGLYAQQMENAEMQAKQYEEEIKYLNKNWQKLGYTEEEYLEKLDELKDGQYDAVKAYNNTKDAIVDLNKERIDAIKNGIEEEIEAYEELIDKKKEELDAEKDLHDFQKSVMDQQKDIADIQRQLAALSGDNSASARAKRAQLQAELAEAQAELEETYYDRSVSNQQEALDKELKNFQEEKDKEKEALDDYLEDTEQVMTDSMGVVQANADGISKTLGETAREYGLTINDALTDPWKEGSGAVKEYTEEFGDSTSATSDALKEIELNNLTNQLEAELAGENAVNEVQENFERYQKAEYIEPKKEEEPIPKEEPEKAIQIGGKINAGSAPIYDYAGAPAEHQYFSEDPIYTVLNEKNGYLLVRHHSLSSGYTGWFKKSDVKAYAKGSKGVNKDQLALIDELGDELLVRAQNGRLTYLEKGSGVVPADLTANLMKWGRLDPSIMLDQNRPSVGVHPEIHNTQIQIDNSIAELIHIDHCDQSTLPDVEKIVNNALEKHTQRLNQSLRKYTR